MNDDFGLDSRTVVRLMARTVGFSRIGIYGVGVGTLLLIGATLVATRFLTGSSPPTPFSPERLRLSPDSMYALKGTDPGPLKLQLANDHGAACSLALRSKSCGCLNVELPDSAIPAGESKPIQLSLNRDSGTLGLSFDLDVNGPSGERFGTVSLAVHVEILPEYDLITPALDQMHRPGQDSLSDQIRVVRHSRNLSPPDETLSLSPSTPLSGVVCGPFRLTESRMLDEAIRRSEYTAAVTIDPRPFADRPEPASLNFPLPDGGTLAVAVNVRKYAPATVSPSLVSFGSVKSGETVERRLLVIPKGDSKLDRVSFKCACPEVTVEPMNAKAADGCLHYAVRYSPQDREKPLTTTILFTIEKDGDTCTLPVSVRGN